MSHNDTGASETPLDPADRLRHAESEVRRLEEAIRRAREEHSARELQWRRELEDAHAAMRAMESSLAWRAARRVYRIRDRLASPGTSRRRLYERVAHRGR